MLNCWKLKFEKRSGSDHSCEMHIACQWHEQTDVIGLSLDVSLGSIPHSSIDREMETRTDIQSIPSHTSRHTIHLGLHDSYYFVRNSVCLVELLFFRGDERPGTSCEPAGASFQCWCLVAYWQKSGIPTITSHCFALIASGVNQMPVSLWVTLHCVWLTLLIVYVQSCIGAAGLWN